MIIPELFDFLVIGSGPAGEKGATQAAYFGKRVAIVERDLEPGGVCVHTGTLPSKTLRETALYLTGYHRGQLYGIDVKLDRRKSLRQLVGRLNNVVTRQTAQIRRNIERHQIEWIHGEARFLEPGTVGVFDGNGQQIRAIRAKAVLIATGSSSNQPRGLPVGDPDIVDSDRILDLDRIPDRLVVVGGGVIGCEYASLFAALGTAVTLIEGRDALLGFLDGELSAALVMALERLRASILLGDAVDKITRLPDKKRDALRVHLKSGKTITADKVLYSAGRTGNTARLNLEAAGLCADERGKIPVDANFQTKVPGIYAAGDVIGNPALASTSMEQARVAACHAFDIGFKRAVGPLFPYGIYTIPEISTIGASEEELRAKNIAYEVGRSRYENNARGQITGELDGFVKIIFDPVSKKLLGAHILGAGATELIHTPQVVMAHNGTMEEFLQMVFNFPTLSECLKYASYDGLQRLSRGSSVRLAHVSPTASAQVPPAARAWFLGADLTDPSARKPRPATVATMDRWRRVQFHTWTFDASATELIPEEIKRESFVLAIDGPQGLAGAGRRIRQAEEILNTAGKCGPRLPTPGKPYGGFITGSVRLFSALQESGFGLLGLVPHDRVDLLETYPADLWKKWAGRRIAPKTSPSGRRNRYDILRGFGLELPLAPDVITHDALDAAACALLAYLWATDKARTFGTAPALDPSINLIREGFIVSV